jgi:hypothetical protein
VIVNAVREQAALIAVMIFDGVTIVVGINKSFFKEQMKTNKTHLDDR